MEMLDILLGFENHLDNHESSKIYEMRLWGFWAWSFCYRFVHINMPALNILSAAK